jgi:dienelactone hydrolase
MPRTLASLALALALGAAPAPADQRLIATCTNVDYAVLLRQSPVPAYGWMGASQAKAVPVMSRQNVCLNAVLYAPQGYAPSSMADLVPGIVVVQGAGGDSAQLGWAGRYFAGHGYVALVIVQRDQGGSEFVAPGVPQIDLDPLALIGGTERLTQIFAGLPPGFNMDNAVDAALSGIDYLLSADNPFPVDPERIGASGHSEGARGVSVAQAIDDRIDAVVAFDNLTGDWSGDSGVCSGGQPQSAITGGELPYSSYPIAPRVPAMGQACDSRLPTLASDAKETAFFKWKGASLPTAELSFQGWNHFAWANVPPASENSSLDIEHQVASYYAGAWYDAFLKGDATGITRLLADSISGMGGAADGSTRTALLSTFFHSGIYLPGSEPGGAVVDCTDFRNDCPAAP